jgi:hypothetical protein
MLFSPATLGQLEDVPAVQSCPELKKQLAEVGAESEMPEPRKEGLLAKAATAITTGLATSAGLQILPNLQKFIQTISGG